MDYPNIQAVMIDWERCSGQRVETFVLIYDDVQEGFRAYHKVWNTAEPNESLAGIGWKDLGKATFSRGYKMQLSETVRVFGHQVSADNYIP